MTAFATINPATAAFALHPTEAEATAAADAGDRLLALSADHLSELTVKEGVALFAATAAPLGIAAVKRFPDRATAARRIWANLVGLSAAEAGAEAGAATDPQPVAQAQAAGQPSPAPRPSAAKAPRRSRGINLAPKAEAKTCRFGTKQAYLVDVLSRSCGASMAERRAGLTPWKDVTIKSGLSWDMNAIKGYGVHTTHENGYQRWLACDYEGMGTFAADSHPDDLDEAEKAALLETNLANGYDPAEVFAVYHLVLPAGLTARVPHSQGPILTVADKMNLLVFGDPLPPGAE